MTKERSAIRKCTCGETFWSPWSLRSHQTRCLVWNGLPPLPSVISNDLASTVTRQRSEIDTARAQLEAWNKAFAQFEGKTLTLTDIPGFGKFWEVSDVS